MMIKKFVPYPLKKIIQSTDLYSIIDSKRLASSSKRLDICAAQFAQLLHLMDSKGIQGQTCLEIGSGWVLSHSLVCYLLGAKKVFATDISPNAHPSNLTLSINKSILSLVRDTLSPFEAHDRIRDRLDRLLKIKKFDTNELKKIGIYYEAPLDFSKHRPKEDIDLIFSFSVLEHIPVDDVENLINNLHSSLNTDGIQAHCIHMEDHKDIPNNPFSFLSIPHDKYSKTMQTDRGNRLRADQWISIFRLLNNADITQLYRWTRNDKKTPKIIDNSIIYTDESDLRTTHIGILATKKDNNQETSPNKKGHR
ncbi:methyltransferase domain-containing protein [Aestuariirhabdus sp. Z084]|uniref:methyltransferase domain-containing protein n=1 Tax=Aestuariirhabdus haliotis TaxID=2918751 RepID=UPI00201B45B6|nr:methyltransferase domain-containing protein [Aestuariirhabdus haliotis]MCL6416094.1 methyltransferase domain-containing protein [Aestuariirhabdus haliotis]MCL6419338.1 methyltransferase domain-containing protein [Aestuariirhabdus haliotis]